MGKKKKQKQEVTLYGMSIHFGVCTGPVDSLWTIFAEEKKAWTGPVTSQTAFSINNLDLFGGEKKEGGMIGRVDWLPGWATQIIPDALAARFGRTAATMPAYRGIASLFFSGSVTRYVSTPGFWWRWNTPYLPGVWAKVARASPALGEEFARVWRDCLFHPSVHFVLDRSADMAGTPFTTLKAAMSEVLDVISDQITNAGLDLNIRISTIGYPVELTSSFVHATAANIAAMKTFVNAITSGAYDADFRIGANRAVEWFNAVDASAGVTRRIFLLVTQGVPTSSPSPAPPGDIAAEAATIMSDLLSRDGGSFNTAAGTAVDCYAINVGNADTQYSAYLDNTAADAVPVISASDTTGLVNAILAALAGEFDSNPAHIIYECLTNPAWGMGSPSSAIDVDSFTAAAETLFDECFGLSMIWTRSGAIEDFVSEVLDHIEATLFVNPRNGLLTIKLIRFDYDIASLPVFTPDNSIVTNFSRKLWGETINEIVATWTNPENEEEETVVAQDLANIEAQGGVISDGRNYYGVRNASLATRLAHRDLRSASTPLAKCDIEINRTAWDLLPGDVCKLDSPEDGIDQIVMRVGPVDYGKPGDSTVRVSLMEDVFSLALADYSEPPDSEWVDTSEPPSPADWSEIITLPYYVVVNGIDAAIVADVDYPEVFAGVLAGEGGQDSDTFQLYGQATDAAGVTQYANFGTKRIASRATLAAAIPAEVETTILSFPDRSQGNGPVVGGLMIIQGADETVSELCLVSDLGVSGYTFERGVLDTVPRAWPEGTPVWFIDETMDFVDDVDIRAEGETVNYKILIQTSQGTLALASAPVVSETMTARPHLPLRPADVKVNGNDGFSGSVDLVGVDPIPVTWARRNRETETAIIKAWDDGDVSPETGQTTVIEVLDPDATSVVTTHAGLSGTSYNVPAASFGGNPSGWIRVGSERDGLRELQGYAIQCILVVPTDVTAAVTGLSMPASVGAVTVGTGAGGTATVSGLSMTASVGAVTVTVPAFATLDGTTSNTTLDTAKLVATHSSTTTNSGARSTALKNSGKYYFEATVVDWDGSKNSIGVVTSAGTFANVAAGTNCAVTYRNGDLWTAGAASSLNIGNNYNGVRIDVATDLDNEKMWFRRQGGNWNDPGQGGYTGLGPPSGTATISNNSLTLSGTTTNISRSPAQKNSGKWYFEVTATDLTATGDGPGIATAACSQAEFTSTVVKCSRVLRTGAIFSNDANSGKSLGTINDGDIIGIAVDLDNDTVWFRKAPSGNWNNDGAANPATNTGGVSCSSYSATTMSPMLGMTAGAATMTANFGNSAFSGSVPSGFTAGWTATASDPAAGTGSLSLSSFSATTLAPVVGFHGTGAAGESGDSTSMNFGQSAFGGSVPSGFAGWPP